MGLSFENSGQNEEVNVNFLGQEKAFQDSWSSKGDDSNLIILPEKKKSNGKAMNKVKERKIQCLSKSQKRKLKKLQEEKEKDALISKSISILEKYKIQEDAISLLRSSGNIGKVETMREKRRRAMQFSKAGLEVPEGDQPCKGRFSDSNLFLNDENDSKQESSENNCLQSMIPEREDSDNACKSFGSHQEPTCSRASGTDGGSYTALPVDVDSSKDPGTCMQEKHENSLLASCNYDESKTTKSLDKEDDTPKVDLCITSISADCAGVERPVKAPTVVHVLRPNEVESNRKDLPIVMMEQEIMEAINEHSTVIICGETGCGKTTQVPQFLYEAGFGSNKSSLKSGVIGVTQPRRVAVLATAKRVAFELGLRLGKEVGFQVRHDKRIGNNCSIKFMTDGILLREVQSDFLLKQYSVIILDEAHERSLNTDILTGMLSRIVELRQRLYEEQQQKVLSGERIDPQNMISQLKLVLMSATLRVDDFVSGKRLFHETPPVIEVPTRQFPVTIHFSKRTEIVDYIGQAYKKVMSIHKRLPPGGVLVFVTGQREVEYLCQKLRKASREMTSRAKMGDEVAAFSEKNVMEPELDMKDIDEAFEIHGDSSHQQTDRFSSYDQDHFDPEVDHLDFPSDSDTESELEFDSDGGDTLNDKTSNAKGDFIDVLGEGGSLGSLKAAFEALASKNALNVNSEGKQSLDATPVTVECSNEPPFTLRKKRDGGDGLCASALRVLPLYAMLPAAAQLRVFDEVHEGERLVVVATNVAETSLTIPGIKYVVDTGREKVKNYNSSSGMESYEVQWISKASAAQRAGRAGRTAPGHCYRLYSSAVFSNILSDFSTAEISKIPVDGVVLLMKSMGIDKVVNFPFPTPPEASALVEAERCLKVLEALDCQGKLTPLGKAMAQYPMSPRHSRMLLTVIQIMRSAQVYAQAHLVLGYAVASAAALSLSNPFIMQFEGTHTNGDSHQDEKSSTEETQKILKKREKLEQRKLKQTARLARAKFSNPRSDALTIAYALQCFELAGNPVEFCNDNALHLKTMEEMSKLRKQLLQLVFQQNGLWDSLQEYSWTHGTIEDVERSWRVSSDKNPLLLNEEELLGQAICAGWADRVAKRIRVVSGSTDGDRKANSVRYQACMVKEAVFLHRRSSVSQSAPEFLVYSDLLHTKRPYIHGATSVKSDWLVKYAGSMCSFSAPFTDPKPYYEPLTDKVFCFVQPTFGPHLWQLPLHRVPINNDILRVSVFAYALLEGHVLPCLRSVQKFMSAPAGSILRPEALGQRRVGNLLNKLKTRSRTIDSRAMLREAWNGNPQELRSEILDWFQDKFRNHFEELWVQMHHEVLLEPQELFPKRLKKGKRRK